MTGEFAGNYPLEDDWHGYINDEDRVLLKVVCIIHPSCCLDFN